MDFLDNAVSKAKEAFEIACKKTGDAVNTGKQKIDVASIENKLSKDYEMLGILYYGMIKEAEDDSLSDDVKELKESIAQKLEKIDSIKEEINNAKSKRTCPSCGSAIDKNSLYCSVCGTRLEYEK